ncbi:MAG: hypothetical protein AB7V32_10305 [Candidatus Berkiella sp.]
MICIKPATNFSLAEFEAQMIQPQFIGEEFRRNHSAHYPLHNRYFSNGDKPWVILVNLKNKMILTYDDKEYIINENELVFFDDNVMHAWQMQNNDMKIYYYRAKCDKPVLDGTYCLDGFLK